MSILFRTNLVYPDGTVGDYRYFQSFFSFAKAIQDGYLKGNYGYVKYTVFSDEPGELEDFNYTRLRAIVDENNKGFPFQEKKLLAESGKSADGLTPDKKAALLRRLHSKAAKTHRDKLVAELESCLD